MFTFEECPWFICAISQFKSQVLAILVNSIFIFIIIIIIILMLGICLVNCVHYPPKILQDHPFSFRSISFSMVNCAEDHDNAIPEEEVLQLIRRVL